MGVADVLLGVVQQLFDGRATTPWRRSQLMTNAMTSSWVLSGPGGLHSDHRAAATVGGNLLEPWRNLGVVNVGSALWRAGCRPRGGPGRAPPSRTPGPARPGLPGGQRRSLGHPRRAGVRGAGATTSHPTATQRSRPCSSKVRRVVGPDLLQGRSSLRFVRDDQTLVDLHHARDALHRAQVQLAAGRPDLGWQPAHTAYAVTRRTFMLGFDAPWIDDWRLRTELLLLDALEAVSRTFLGGGGPAGGRTRRSGPGRAGAVPRERLLPADVCAGARGEPRERAAHL